MQCGSISCVCPSCYMFGIHFNSFSISSAAARRCFICFNDVSRVDQIFGCVPSLELSHSSNSPLQQLTGSFWNFLEIIWIVGKLKSKLYATSLQCAATLGTTMLIKCFICGSEINNKLIEKSHSSSSR